MSHVNRKAVSRQMPLLSRQEALAILERCNERGVPIPFAIVFCTADEERGTGGEIISYDKAVLHVPGGRIQKSESFERVGGKSTRKKTPKSSWMRNIRGIDTNQPRKVHVDLILRINGQSVK